MRIENQNLTGVAGSGNSGAIRPADSNSAHAVNAQDKSDDTVSLSSAASLITLSKTLNSSDKQSRITQLAAQVQSGTYRADLASTSRALIDSKW